MSHGQIGESVYNYFLEISSRFPPLILSNQNTQEKISLYLPDKKRSDLSAFRSESCLLNAFLGLINRGSIAINISRSPRMMRHRSAPLSPQHMFGGRASMRILGSEPRKLLRHREAYPGDRHGHWKHFSQLAQRCHGKRKEAGDACCDPPCPGFNPLPSGSVPPRRCLSCASRTSGHGRTPWTFGLAFWLANPVTLWSKCRQGCAAT